MKNKKITIFILTTALLLGGCSSSKVIPGQVYSDADYEIMGKSVSFSKYGFAALDKNTKRNVRVNKNKLIQSIDDIFLDENEKYKTIGIINIYSDNY